MNIEKELRAAIFDELTNQQEYKKLMEERGELKKRIEEIDAKIAAEKHHPMYMKKSDELVQKYRNDILMEMQADFAKDELV